MNEKTNNLDDVAIAICSDCGNIIVCDPISARFDMVCKPCWKEELSELYEDKYDEYDPKVIQAYEDLQIANRKAKVARRLSFAKKGMVIMNEKKLKSFKRLQKAGFLKNRTIPKDVYDEDND